MAAELVVRPQAPPAALSAKAATTTIPIVFVVGFDPAAAGPVPRLNRPGGNVTGVTLMSVLLGQKRLEMLRELGPKASVIAMLANPVSPDALPEFGPVQAAAKSLGLQLSMFNASTPSEIDAAFNAIVRPDSLLVGTDSFLLSRRELIVAWAARLRITAIYPFREFAEAGGLISYGTNIPITYRQAGIYCGQILRVIGPTSYLVIQPTTFELVINLKTAQMLSVDIPATLHVR